MEKSHKTFFVLSIICCRNKIIQYPHEKLTAPLNVLGVIMFYRKQLPMNCVLQSRGTHFSNGRLTWVCRQVKVQAEDQQ